MYLTDHVTSYHCSEVRFWWFFSNLKCLSLWAAVNGSFLIFVFNLTLAFYKQLRIVILEIFYLHVSARILLASTALSTAPEVINFLTRFIFGVILHGRSLSLIYWIKLCSFLFLLQSLMTLDILMQSLMNIQYYEWSQIFFFRYI